jgi:hypothetical protein
MHAFYPCWGCCRHTRALNPGPSLLVPGSRACPWRLTLRPHLHPCWWCRGQYCIAFWDAHNARVVKVPSVASDSVEEAVSSFLSPLFGVLAAVQPGCIAQSAAGCAGGKPSWTTAAQFWISDVQSDPFHPPAGCLVRPPRPLLLWSRRRQALPAAFFLARPLPLARLTLPSSCAWRRSESKGRGPLLGSMPGSTPLAPPHRRLWPWLGSCRRLCAEPPARPRSTPLPPSDSSILPLTMQTPTTPQQMSCWRSWGSRWAPPPPPPVANVARPLLLRATREGAALSPTCLPPSWEKPRPSLQTMKLPCAFSLLALPHRLRSLQLCLPWLRSAGGGLQPAGHSPRGSPAVDGAEHSRCSGGLRAHPAAVARVGVSAIALQRLGLSAAAWPAQLCWASVRPLGATRLYRLLPRYRPRRLDIEENFLCRRPTAEAATQLAARLKFLVQQVRGSWVWEQKGTRRS